MIIEHLIKENPAKNGKYEGCLEPGNYRVFIFKDGYEEYHKEITLMPGNNSFKVNLRTMVHSSHEDHPLGKRPCSASFKGSRPLSGSLRKNVSFDGGNQEEANPEPVPIVEQTVLEQKVEPEPEPVQRKKGSVCFKIFDASSSKPLPDAQVKVIYPLVLA
jgi:hypothetical protein